MKWLHVFLIVITLFIVQRCATQTSPSGGPKDSIPPRLIRSLPENNQKNYKGKTVTLEFNEFIKLKDQKEIIITPSVGKNVNITAKAKTLTIEPKEKWADSTTYSIAFRDAIQDLTESLPAQSLHLAFSTGSIIDSLSISGNIHETLKETIPERVTIALYQSDTFKIFKHSPVYFTESNKDGTFKISNLKPGIYHIYAFVDKNKNLKTDSQSELYGFKSDTINLSSNRTKININLIKVDTRKLKVNNVRHNSRMTTIKLSKPVSIYKLENLNGKIPLNTYGDTQAEIYVYHDESIKDSVAFLLTASDSVAQSIDTVVYVKESDGRFVKETFKVTVTNAEFGTESGILNADIKMTVPLKRIQEDTLEIIIDTTFTVKIAPKDIKIDTVNKKAHFKCAIDRKTLDDLTTPVLLFFSKGVFISIDDDSSKLISNPISYLKEEETGKISVDIITKAPHYIIQIVDKDYKVIQEYRDKTKVDFTFLKPQSYKIRAIIDTNNNGIWDIGSYDLNIEPERMIYLKISPKTFDTPLRANWESTTPSFSF